MKNLLSILLAVVGIGVTAFAIIMLVSAIRFGELGRVVLYTVITILAIKLSVWAILRIVKK